MAYFRCSPISGGGTNQVKIGGMTECNSGTTYTIDTGVKNLKMFLMEKYNTSDNIRWDIIWHGNRSTRIQNARTAVSSSSQSGGDLALDSHTGTGVPYLVSVDATNGIVTVRGDGNQTASDITWYAVG